MTHAFNSLLASLLLLLAAFPALGQTVEYIHTDALGTPIAVTDASRNIVESSEYEPYGQLLNRLVTDGPGFTGHVQDAATGLTYMQQRYFDNQIGRFLSVDPVTAYANFRGNFNRYWYANNNPYRFNDPDGRLAVDDHPNHRPGPSPVRPTSDRTSVEQAESTMGDNGDIDSTGPVIRSGWMRPHDHPYVVGRYGTIVEPGPGNTRGKFLDDSVPGFHTMGTLHDEFVDRAVDEGVPDELANIPSMGAAYGLAVGAETVNMNVGIVNSILNTIGYPVNLNKPFEHTHVQSLSDQLKSQGRQD